MNKVEEVITKVKTILEDYDASGLISEDLLYDDALTAIKSFGNDLTMFKESVLEVKNGKAVLPEDFYAMSTVMLVEPYRCNDVAIEYRTLTGFSFIEDTKILTNNWNECEDCCRNMDEKYIRKEQYVSNKLAIVDYNRGKFLKHGKTFDKSVCNKSIREVWKQDEVDEFIIVGKELRLNFNKDVDVYIVYKGFPTDEEGNVDIVDTPNGHLYNYLERKLMERAYYYLILKTKGSIPMLAQFKAEEDAKARVARHNAHTDLKMMNFNLKRLSNRIAIRNKAEARINSIIG